MYFQVQRSFVTKHLLDFADKVQPTKLRKFGALRSDELRLLHHQKMAGFDFEIICEFSS
jgi:hypothetical protein